RVADRTGVVVAARSAVWLRGVRAHAGRRVARAGVVAFVLRGADDGRSGHAAAALAHVADGTRVIVGARTAAGFGRIGARAGRRVARAGVVALIDRGADDRRARRAAPELARIADRAGVAVLARCAVDRRRMDACAGRRVALVVGAGVAVGAVDGRSRDTCARRRVARLDAGAHVAVAAVGVDGAATGDPDRAPGGSRASSERTCDDDRERETQARHPLCIPGQCLTTKLNSVLCQDAWQTRRDCDLRVAPVPWLFRERRMSSVAFATFAPATPPGPDPYRRTVARLSGAGTVARPRTGVDPLVVLVGLALLTGVVAAVRHGRAVDVRRTASALPQPPPATATVDAVAGEPIRFTIIARTATPRERLRLTWLVDGMPAGKQESLTFRANEPGIHLVRAVVASSLGAAATREWRVNVAAAAVPAVPVAVPPPAAEPPAGAS